MNDPLKYLDIQGFQSWKRGRIPLAQFNLLIGKSSAGKTALLRAFEFHLLEEWDGSWANDEKKSTAVALEWASGIRVLRVRKEKQNQAAIARGGETTKFKSFGDTIPGIHSIINVRPIEVGSKSVNLNFSLQDDPIFMVSASAYPRPVKAQWIGRLYGAHLINEMLRAMSKDKKSTESKRKDAEDRLVNLESELSTYNHLLQQDAYFAEAKSQLVTYKELVVIARSHLNVAVLRRSLEEDAWATNVDTKSIRDEIETLAVLRVLSEQQSRLIKEKVSLKSNSKLLSLNTSEVKGDIDILESLTQIYVTYGKLKALRENCDATRLTTNKDAQEARAALDKAILANNKCPVCSGPIEGDHEHILKNVAKLVGVDR